MQSLLFLCHRIPYPPNKGDKIRSYNMLKFLSKNYKVHLGAFVDDPDDFQYKSTVVDLCESHCLLPLIPKLGKLRSLSGFVKGTPLGLPYYYNGKMQSWVNAVIAENNLNGVLVFSSTMAQYVAGDRFTQLKRYIDFIDIDSDKWAQYKKQASLVMRWVYGYEARTLFSWEKRIASEFDASFFVSEKEAELFKKMVPEVAEKISYFNNGVDTEYFSPDHVFDSPFSDEHRAIVFTGAMGYWANVDAVIWFVKEVFSEVGKKLDNVKFYIVGSKPDEKVKALAALPNVIVTGAVDDVRPYLAHASVAVAPMRIARGVQNKVLEAMAMALPTITSPQGYEGINAIPGKELLVIGDIDEWVDTLVSLISNTSSETMGQAARRSVVSNYSWQSSLSRLKHYLDGTRLGD